MTVELSLTVNEEPIQTDYFVAGFIDHTVSGMVESLEGTGKVKDLELTLDGEEVAIILNGKTVPINAFVKLIFKSTLTGMVSPLKGVKGKVKNLKIVIRK
jgi:hypothetical protein